MSAVGKSSFTLHYLSSTIDYILPTGPRLGCTDTAPAIVAFSRKQVISDTLTFFAA